MPEHIKPLKIVSVQFSIPIRNEDLPLFRGAVIETTKRSNDLFHNHNSQGVIYRYPLIQYKKIGGKAALLCLGDGTDAIHDFFANTDWSLRLGDRQEEIRVEEVKSHQFNVGVWETQFDYSVKNWLPLNQENYLKYQQAESLSEKTGILEKVLLGNLLTFAEGIGLHTDKKVTAVITRIAREKVLRYRGQLMQCYDLHIRTNLSVPDYCSLGKGASVGYGVVMSEK